MRHHRLILAGAALIGMLGTLQGRTLQQPRLPFPLVERFESWDVEDGLPAAKVHCVLASGDRVFAGTDRGLAVMESGRWRTLPAEGGPARNVVLALAQGPTGGVWAGTFGGLLRVSAGRVDVFTQTDSGLPNDVVYAVAVTPDAVWAATAAGLGRLDPDTGSWALFDHTNTLMHEPWCYGLAVAPGRLYVGVWGGGVVEHRLPGGGWKEHRDPDKEMELDLLPDDGPVHDVTSSVAWADGVLWQGTYFGLSRYDGARWRTWVEERSPLPSGFINFVAATGRTAWLGSDCGLTATDGETWATYRRDTKAGGTLEVRRGKSTLLARTMDTALPCEEVLGIHLDRDRVWIATSAGVACGVFAPVRPGPDDADEKDGR